MTEQSLNFSFKARYYKLGALDKTTNRIWFVLHGYGQLAKYFIQKFAPLANSQTCVIAPEGLSRFYMEDLATRSQTGNNRVGATWMTRESRLTDIENYCEYLTAIYKTEVENHPHVRVTILGFSQGAATASRWALDSRINFNRLILWAGILPPDMNFEKGRAVLSGKEFIVAHGTGDPWITPDRMQEMEALIVKLGIAPKYIVYEGAHDLHEETLLRLNAVVF